MQPVAVAAAASLARAGASAGAPGVDALLAAHGCLACHALDRELFGPSDRTSRGSPGPIRVRSRT